MPFGVLALLECAVRAGTLPPSLSASPTAVFRNALSLISEGPLVLHTAYSVRRIILSVALALISGVLCGAVLSQYKFADRLFSPTLQFVAPVPVVAWMPFVVLLVGSGESFKIALAALAGFILIQIHTYQGMRDIPTHLIESAKLSQFSTYEHLTKILLPGAAPSIFVGLRLSLAIAWVVIFFVEYGSATQGSEGLGWFIADSRSLGRIEDEYAGLFVLGGIGYTSDWLLLKVRALLIPWAYTG